MLHHNLLYDALISCRRPRPGPSPRTAGESAPQARQEISVSTSCRGSSVSSSCRGSSVSTSCRGSSVSTLKQRSATSLQALSVVQGCLRRRRNQEYGRATSSQALPPFHKCPGSSTGPSAASEAALAEGAGRADAAARGASEHALALVLL